MILPTVRVKKAGEVGGYRIINESDYDESVHELWTEESAESDAVAVNEQAAKPVITHKIAKNGSWTVFSDGNEVEKGRGADSLASFLATLE